MISESFNLYLLLGASAAIAGFVRGYAGFGGPLIMLPVLAAVLPPAAAIWVMMWVDMLANLRLLPDAVPDASRRVILPLILGTLATLPAGNFVLTAFDADVLRRGIYVVILAGCLVLATGWRFPKPATPITLGLAGSLTGLIMGATSLAISAVLFLQASNQTAQESRANFIVWVFLATSALLALMVVTGRVDSGHPVLIAALGALYLGAAAVGARLFREAKQERARRAVLTLASLIALTGLLTSWR